MIAPSRRGGRHLVRPYEPADREAVRRICCETGFLGNPVDPVFEDRELFADYLTRYYTDLEPEATFVVVKEGEVRGYATGCRRLGRRAWFDLWHNTWLALRGISRYYSWPYNRQTRHYIHWMLTQAGDEVPEPPPNCPHVHFNVLPDARGIAETHDLLQGVLNHMAACGERSVYGQVVTFEDRRAERVFERFGFTIASRREVTKFREVHPGKVFLTTIVKDLTANVDLYWNPRRKKATE